MAFNSGKEIPEGWALDKNGSPTKNPGDVYDGGMLLPAAGHKGFGLALLTDYLGGILTGAGGPGIPGSILGNGVLFIFLNISYFRPLTNSSPMVNISPVGSKARSRRLDSMRS